MTAEVRLIHMSPTSFTTRDDGSAKVNHEFPTRTRRTYVYLCVGVQILHFRDVTASKNV
jgi:hypothetical protein